ncbi:MAG: hypothetical protein IJZ20_01460, partial [Clostridia bacterium]|nr:hypothetical protein [Clostridia bacterium]
CKYRCTPDEVYKEHLAELQQEIMNDGCYLPWKSRKIPECTLNARCNLSDEDKALLFNGLERPDKNDSINYVSRETNSSIEFEFEKAVKGVVRLVLDIDYSRKSVSDDPQFRRYSIKCNAPVYTERIKMPKNLAKALKVTVKYTDGSEKVLYETENNYKHLIFLPTDGEIVAMKAQFFGAWQCETSNVFSFDLVER